MSITITWCMEGSTIDTEKYCGEILAMVKVCSISKLICTFEISEYFLSLRDVTFKFFGTLIMILIGFIINSAGIL